jgi:hypothetical protein
MNTNLPIIPSGDDVSLPLPLIVAQKWEFPLAHVKTDNDYFYAVQDWIRGLTNEKDVTRILAKLKNQTSTSSRPLPYTASDGKTYQRDFTDDKGLYLIAQYLRTTKARPMLAAIKTYLSEAGAFVDLVRREPDTVITSGAIDPDAAIDAAIEAYRKQGKDDRWISARLTGKIKRIQFTTALKAAVADMLTKQHYALATDEIYKGLWGRTASILKDELHVSGKISLRDHQPAVALSYQALAEEVAAQKLGNETELAWEQARYIVRVVAEMIGTQAQQTATYLQMDLATGKPLLPFSHDG